MKKKLYSVLPVLNTNAFFQWLCDKFVSVISIYILLSRAGLMNMLLQSLYEDAFVNI